ncbi:MAG: 5-formyltetrahydrofolate cyclo-ligase, partial [Sphingomicrobium sp.]
AIKYPRGLSLVGSWSGTYGSHLTFVASEDFRQTATVVPSPPLPANEAKAALRVEVRRRRRLFVAGLSQVERDDLQASLGDALQLFIAPGTSVAAYHAVGSEIDPAAVLRLAMERGCTAALPAFEQADGPMLFRLGVAVENGPHGIPQPPRQAKVIIPDLLLVPLLAVDCHGMRLGQGGGHYDRALPALRDAGATIIGVGWAMQMIDGKLPADPWDVPLDGFASPEGVTMWR